MPAQTYEKEGAELTHPKYRPDIDGLRAIAVLSVVGFHAIPRTFHGGFLGVDIFFVISGFLISTIIFGNLEHGSFSFATFYARRIKRIFPALVTVLAACLAAGWFMLLADEYQQLGKHTAGAAAFIANFLFWRETGYFDTAAATKPLLHLWSLGIEEQYYLIWPLLVWAAWKSRSAIPPLMAALMAASLCWSLWQSFNDATADFYSPQTRFWELLAGSALAYAKLHGRKSLTCHNDAVSAAGLVLIVVSIFALSSKRMPHFPGGWPLLPDLGAVLLIAAGEKAWANRKILSRQPLVWFGLISYPLYLWHWPLLVFARIWQDELNTWTSALLVLVAIALAWLTYAFVEKPIRWGRWSRKGSRAVLPLVLAMTVSGVLGCTIYANGGMEGYGYRSPEKSAFAEYFKDAAPDWHYFTEHHLLQNLRKDCDFYNTEEMMVGHSTDIPREHLSDSCYKRDTTRKKAVFLWGDSHAQHLYYGLNRQMPKDWQVMIVATSGCTPALVDEAHVAPRQSCSTSNFFALNTIKKEKPDVVILAHAKHQSFEDFSRIAEALLNLGVKKVVVMGPTPQWRWGGLPKIILRRLWDNTPERTYYGTTPETWKDNDRLRSGFAAHPRGNIVFVDLIGFFCTKDGCLTRIGNDRMTGITARDYGHLTLVASDYLAKNLLVKAVTSLNSQ